MWYTTSSRKATMQEIESPYDIKDFIFIDVETTGVNLHDSSSYFDKHIIKKDLIQIGIAWTEDGTTTQSVHSFVRPPANYFEVQDDWYKNGEEFNVSPKSVVNAPTWDKLFPWIQTLIGNKTPVAHNADFDAQVLIDTSFHYGLRFLDRPFWKCTMQDSKELVKELSNHSLKEMADYFNINMGNHHNAVDDAKTCLEIFRELQFYRKRPDWIFV